MMSDIITVFTIILISPITFPNLQLEVLARTQTQEWLCPFDDVRYVVVFWAAMTNVNVTRE
jgi:hypothetical protein